MKISIGLPTALPGTPPDIFVPWAQRAEQAGFASLGTIGRTVYDSYEELMVLAAVAAVTRTIGLATTVLIAPPREAVLLAKQAATLQALSQGRLCLGLGVGWREDDFSVVGADWKRRGQTMEQLLVRLREVWQGGEVGPFPSRPPELMLGGASPSALERAGRHADAFMAGPFATSEIVALYAAVCSAAESHGRRRPRFVTSRYFSLGDETRLEGNVRRYFEIGGEGAIRAAREMVLTSPEQIRQVIEEHREAGSDELCLWTQQGTLDQIERLAEIVF